MVWFIHDFHLCFYVEILLRGKGQEKVVKKKKRKKKEKPDASWEGRSGGIQWFESESALLLNFESFWCDAVWLKMRESLVHFIFLSFLPSFLPSSPDSKFLPGGLSSSLLLHDLVVTPFFSALSFLFLQGNSTINPFPFVGWNENAEACHKGRPFKPPPPKAANGAKMFLILEHGKRTSAILPCLETATTPQRDRPPAAPGRQDSMILAHTTLAVALTWRFGFLFLIVLVLWGKWWLSFSSSW